MHFATWSRFTGLALLIALAGCSNAKQKHSALEAAGRSPVIDHPGDLDCGRLSSGLYWYGKGNQAQLATAAGSEFYDPSKPTLIFFHGWEQFGVQNRRRETFVVPTTTASPDVDVAGPWIDAGWNMGIFDWTQFSAVSLLNAESAIWTAGNDGFLPWTTCSGQSTDGVMPGASVTDMATAAIKAAMGDYKGDNIRLVGHSLGAQLATRVADALQKDEGGNLTPKRVALLDPYWTVTNQPNSADATTDIVSRMQKETVWELYKTSAILDLWLGAQNVALTNLIGELKYQPNYWGFNPFTKLVNQHLVARKIYFSSFTSQPPEGCQGAFDAPCLSAANSDEQVGQFMKQGQAFVQTAGTTTETLTDDKFSAKSMWNGAAAPADLKSVTSEQVLSAAASLSAGLQPTGAGPVDAATVSAATGSDPVASE